MIQDFRTWCHTNSCSPASALSLSNYLAYLGEFNTSEENRKIIRAETDNAMVVVFGEQPSVTMKEVIANG